MGENGKENLQVVSRNVLITPCRKISKKEHSTISVHLFIWKLLKGRSSYAKNWSKISFYCYRNIGH